MHNAQVAAGVLYADEKSGLMLTRCIDDIVRMSPVLFRERPGSSARAAHALRRLHQSGRTFEFRFELFSMIDDYLGILATKGAELPEGYTNVVAAAEPVRAVLDANPLPLAPCHCDPLCENFLDDGERMWVVDWEYSGMNDPI
jgi:thiamine kinase-like enzyme